MTIQIRAILVIISTNFVIILLSILAGTGYVRENIEDYIEADMMVVADIGDQFISTELDLLRYEAGEVADELAAAELANWNEILEEQTKEYPKFLGMSVMNRNTGITASAGKMPASSALLENKYVQRAFSGEKSFTSTVPTENGVMFYLAVPIPDETEHVLALTVDGMYFSNLASEYHVWKTGHIFIDDSEGYVIANIRPEWVQKRQNFIQQAKREPQYEGLASVVKKLIGGGRGIGYYSVNGVARICAYRPIAGSKEGWCLGIVAPLSESPVRNVNMGLFVVAVVSFLLNVVAAVVGSTFIKKPFEKVAALQEAAESSSRAKSSFLAHMSHEIRTPLNAVVGLSELALEDAQQESGMKDKLEKIYGSGMTILSIVNDILDISKIESGKFELYPVQYDTPSMINDTVTLNIVGIGEKPITFQLEVDENLPSSLYGDDLRVKQIFSNLLSNAFKYTDSGIVKWSVSFEKEPDGIWLVSNIQDSGIGIRPEDVQKLFSDYNQVDTKANRKVEGTGLGLAITKRLVEMMGGTISVSSKYGKGTAFHIRLRQMPVSDKPIGKKVAENLMTLRYTLSKRSQNTKLIRADLSYAHILVVDDIVTNLDVVKGMMKPYGMSIDCVLSGQQAVDMIRSASPRYNAVFMDHMMPGMDGIEATQIIRKKIGTDYARNIPIIALTANAIVGNEEFFLSQGFNDFISKPIDVTKLDAVLRRWVRDKNLEKSRNANEDVSLREYVTKNENRRPVNKDSLSKGITINGIDKFKCLKYLDGDESAFINILRSYAASIPPLLNRLRADLAAENLEDYAVIVHGIKGASNNICAQQVGKNAEFLEKAAKSGDFDTVKTTHLAFQNITEELLDNINRTLEKIDADSQKPVAAEPDPALLKELRDACKAFDMDRVDNVMSRLESFRYESGGKLIAWLREQINGMAFEDIFNGKWPSM